MFTIIFCWVIVVIAIIFIGKLFFQNIQWYESFWMGLVITIAVLQIWSIFLPVNIYALITVLTMGLLSLSLVFRKNKFPKIKKIKDWVVGNRIFIFATCLTFIVVSYYASQPVGWDDSLLYHLNAVKWGKLYSVVPGLANLHSRLGFNSSFFLFASMLDNWLIDRSSHIALSILAIVLSIEYIWIFIKSNDRSLKLFCLFTMPLIFYSIAYREIIASLSPDFAVTVIILATSIQFLKKEKSSNLIAGFLSILLITVKFTVVPFSIFVLIYVFYMHRDFFVRILSGCILLIVPFLIRNIYLSGWPLYPLPLFKISVDWAMPPSQVDGLYTVIKTWAKYPGTEWTKYIDATFWEWFPVWYQSNQSSFEIKILAFSFILVLMFPFLKIVNKKYLFRNKKLILLCIASFISLIYILFTAPDLRFGAIFVWIFFASVLSLYFRIFKWNHNIKFLAIIATIVFLIFISWPVRFDNEPILRSIRWEQPWPTKNVNGILMPVKLGFCGNSDLPCTPEENKIKERVFGDISKGFMPAN